MKKEFKNKVSEYAYEKYLKKYDVSSEENVKAEKSERAKKAKSWWRDQWLNVAALIATVIGTIITIIEVLR